MKRFVLPAATASLVVSLLSSRPAEARRPPGTGSSPGVHTQSLPATTPTVNLLTPGLPSPISATPYFSDVAPQMNATAPGYGAGTSWGDYDDDGDLDLYVVNLGYQGSGQANVLLRNDGSTFTDFTAAAGVGDGGPGVAAVWGDMDNDGDLDLFVSNRPGNNALYRNEGDGHFTNVAAQAGVTDPSGWGEGSAWIDHDGDGLLDLYVANLYVQGYQPNRLYHNLDGFHFVDVAGPLGIADTGNGEGIAWADFDNDGDMDLYIANAYGTNALYLQQSDGTFLNVTAQMHVPGGPGNSYGVAWGDYDNDGWLDLYVAQQGANKLYRNLGGSDFADVTDQAGVGGGSNRWSLGCAWGDFDSDGWLDLHVANATVGGYDPGDILYCNLGGSPPTFADGTALAGVTNTLDTRGSAWGDFDHDGDLDLYVVNQGTSGEPNRLFHNNGNANHWLHVIAIGRVSNLLAICVRVQQADFTWMPAGPIAGQVVTFTASATGSLPIAFAWDWGDGFTATGALAVHTYSVAGRYTVTLAAENACGLERVTHSVAVAPPAYRIYLPILLKSEVRR